MIPGIVDFQLIQAALRTPKPQSPGAYRFGRLSHHSFFSRHHPHPQHVTHIQGRPGGGQGLAEGGGPVLRTGKGGRRPCFGAEAQRGWRFGSQSCLATGKDLVKGRLDLWGRLQGQTV